MGLNTELKKAFPILDTQKITKPKYIFTGIPDPNWVAGFSSDDASFNLKISKSSTNIIGIRVQLRFSIELNIIEKQLIFSIANYLLNSNDSVKKTFSNDILSYTYMYKDYLYLEITNLSDIFNHVIPFFNSYPMQGVKSLDLDDLKTVGILIKNKEHLTP